MMSKSETKADLKPHKQILTFETAMYQGLKFTDIDKDIDKDTTTKVSRRRWLSYLEIYAVEDKVCA